jgi:deoxyribodipyrimidine photolyase-related protein
VDRAVKAYAAGHAPLASVEGFVRQILGWREYVRGIYWTHMPEYETLNVLDHSLAVPGFFWNGTTDMECLHQAMGHLLEYGYTHHIQRLMVLGLFALLYGVHPIKFHEWHLAMYLDAVDWVSLPNTLGMSQYGDGGIMGTKPYCATGNYIHRMSNYCGHCRYRYRESLGEQACPLTTLYWDFLDRHYEKLRKNPRMALQIRNLENKARDGNELRKIRSLADRLRSDWARS